MDTPPIEYTAQAASPIVNGEVKMTIGENSLTASALLDTAEIPFVKMDTLEYANHNITVRTEKEEYVFSRMGNWAQPFFDALCEAYNKAVLRAFFISGNHILATTGDYRFIEGGIVFSGSKVPIRVYENCVVTLPPNTYARRIPLCFVNKIDKGEHELTLKLNTGESYTFSKMGYDTVPFTEAVEKNIRALREKSIAAVNNIDPSLSIAQASQIAKLMPEGAAVPMGQLAAIAPSFASYVDAKMAQTRAADSYALFKEICDATQIRIGFMKNSIGWRKADNSAEAADSSIDDAVPSDPYLFWIIAPAPNDQYCAVEFAVQSDEHVATFVFRTNGNFQTSAENINRAMEAISFKREVIRLADRELKAPNYIDYYMAAKRTASLQYVRTSFVGRVIHSNPESWKRRLVEMGVDGTTKKPNTPKKRLCSWCGIELPEDAEHCEGCGMKF
ncbi:MAG: hypothetical protein FWG96_05930 [Methanomassiliicoccaceae archaeon]|nr:hypothetical protein [Methanomassiliicoccaceae archaeon]